MTTPYDPERLEPALQEWRERPIEPFEKGFSAIGPITPGSVVERGLRIDDLTLPVMVLREAALTSNVETMAEWCRAHQVLHAPHGKTPMSPEILARQLRAGVWGITAATIGQVRTFVDVGVRRVLLANQLVDPVGIEWLAGALTAQPDLTVLCYVDSVEGVALLDRQLAAAGATRRLPVLVELGVPGRRTGARTMDEALRVADTASRTPTLDVVGASAFEGVLGPRNADTMESVAELCRGVRELGLRIADAPIVSAGGSTYFDVVAEALSGSEASTVVIRSGGYVTHDEGLYWDATPLPTGGSPYALTPAIDVWGHVLSRPEPTRVLVGAGRRDLPYDVKLPLVRGVPGAVVAGLNDQHAFLDVPESCDLAVGDRVCFGIAHPCTAFDKWRIIPIVDDSDRIVEISHTLF